MNSKSQYAKIYCIPVSPWTIFAPMKANLISRLWFCDKHKSLYKSNICTSIGSTLVYTVRKLRGSNIHFFFFFLLSYKSRPNSSILESTSMSAILYILHTHTIYRFRRTELRFFLSEADSMKHGNVTFFSLVVSLLQVFYISYTLYFLLLNRVQVPNSEQWTATNKGFGPSAFRKWVKVGWLDGTHSPTVMPDGPQIPNSSNGSTRICSIYTRVKFEKFKKKRKNQTQQQHHIDVQT